MYCGCCAGSIGGKQIGDFLAILRGIAPQNRAEDLDGFIPVDIVGAQRNGDSLGFERLQNCTRILALLRGEIGVVQNPVIKLALMLCLLMPVAAFAEEASDGKMIVYAKLPSDWSDPHLWAWADDGTNAFDAWPGGEMEADSNNDGWYYCWIPETTNNIIINANDAAVQTSDYKLESKNAWVTVTDAENVEISYDAQTTGDLPEYVEKFKIHAQVPDDWQDVCLWAWSAPDGKNAFEAWPGKTMSKGEDGWYTASAPVWVNSIIVNGNSGDVQTEDISIDAAEVWVTVSEDGTSDFTYNDPNAPVAEDITVHVKAPADWSEPHLWAWSAPDGTNAFSSWPGEALQEGEDGWLTLSVPGWVNSIIVNGSDGSVQTSDLSVETGKDLWIVVSDAENAEVTYEAPAETVETAEAPAAESEPTVAAEPAETKSNAMPIAIVVVVVIAVVAGGVVISKKKK